MPRPPSTRGSPPPPPEGHLSLLPSTGYYRPQPKQWMVISAGTGGNSDEAKVFGGLGRSGALGTGVRAAVRPDRRGPNGAQRRGQQRGFPRLLRRPRPRPTPLSRPP